jgi:hypothetical protein
LEGVGFFSSDNFLHMLLGQELVSPLHRKGRRRDAKTGSILLQRGARGSHTTGYAMHTGAVS